MSERKYDYIDRALLAATLQAEASVTDTSISPLWRLLALAAECKGQGTRGGADAAAGIGNWLRDFSLG